MPRCQYLLDNRQATITTRHHHWHPRNRRNVVSEPQALGLLRQRPTVPDIALHGQGLVAAPGNSTRSTGSAVSHSNRRSALGQFEPGDGPVKFQCLGMQHPHQVQ